MQTVLISLLKRSGRSTLLLRMHELAESQEAVLADRVFREMPYLGTIRLVSKLPVNFWCGVLTPVNH